MPGGAHDIDPSAVGDITQAHRVEVEQQGIGPYVVGACRVVVEPGWIVRRQIEITAVQHQVAAYPVQPASALLGEPQPELLQGELRVAIAIQDQIAIQLAILQFAVHPRLGFPGVCRTEQVERGIGGQQLHVGGRVHRALRMQADQRLGMSDLAYLDGDSGRRDAGFFSSCATTSGKAAASVWPVQHSSRRGSRRLMRVWRPLPPCDRRASSSPFRR